MVARLEDPEQSLNNEAFARFFAGHVYGNSLEIRQIHIASALDAR
jgi:hypothetical protein